MNTNCPLTWDKIDISTERDLVRAGIIWERGGMYSWHDTYRGEVSREFDTIWDCMKSLRRRIRSHDDLARRDPAWDAVDTKPTP